MTTPTPFARYRTIAFQGAPGAYSDLACRTMFPDLESRPCATFEDAFRAVTSGETDLAMIAVENTLAGRVADVHNQLPSNDLHIIGEWFLPVRHALLTVPGARPEDVKHVHSHIHALPQCRDMIRRRGLSAHVHADTAGAAADIAVRGDRAHAAIASTLAGSIYGLDVMEENVQDADHNTTRFLVFSRDSIVPDYDLSQKVMTSFLFRVRNIPAALYKALGGFATNGVNMTKLESYIGEQFRAARFYCDVEGHPDSPNLKLALEELRFFADDVRIVGTYPAHPFRS